jgi:hypothetical protein
MQDFLTLSAVLTNVDIGVCERESGSIGMAGVLLLRNISTFGHFEYF